MATVTHIIRSHYDPADRDRLEHETGQRTDGDDPWQTESSFSAQRRIRAAPTFIPATLSYDEWGVPSPPPTAEKPAPSSSTASWYRSLTAASAPRVPPRPSSAPGPTQDAHPQPTSPWFISKALRSEPPTKPSSPAPSLADLLARDPPPLPAEGRFRPPVWLHIGPSNRGFGMLQRSGWNEGEGLGAHLAHAEVAEPVVSTVVESGVSDVQTGREVIDLTLESDSETEDALEDVVIEPSPLPIQMAEASGSHLQKSLLTPLPTVLKADRLGIGLKAKTEGPYKQSKKRVTHGAAALAAHIRSAEELRKKRAEVGKGKRGFAKVHRREEDLRKSMLAYLNE